MGFQHNEAEDRERLQECKKVSLIDYIRDNMNLDVKRKGKNYLMLSPFSDERKPSLYFFPDRNKFYDYSSGKRGDLLDFVSAFYQISLPKAIDVVLGEKMVRREIDPERKPDKRMPFKLSFFETRSQYFKNKCKTYARGRGIPDECYVAGSIPEYRDGSNVPKRIPALLFLHQSDFGEVIGFKARYLHDGEQRFTARGSLKYYVLRNDSGYGEEILYVTESETSSASLYAYLKENYINFTILCFGGVNQVGLKIPEEYRNLDKRFLVIDYDGDEELYQSRVQKFEHLNCKNVKIPVKKGEDINSLCMKRMINDYRDLIIQ